MVVKTFFSVFHGKQLPPTDRIDAIFATYINDTITMDWANGIKKLNSMSGVIRYINDHKDTVKTCNFTPFGTEVGDIKTLADYLAQSSCTIRAIGIKCGVSEETQATLAKAVQVRNGGLKVQYV